MNLYIGNLSYNVKESDLRHVMEEYGTVASVKLITDRETRRSKGFAFVEMPDDAEAFSQNVAGGDGGDAQLRCEDLGLRSLSRAGRSQQNQSHSAASVISQGNRSSCASSSEPQWPRRSQAQR